MTNRFDGQAASGLMLDLAPQRGVSTVTYNDDPDIATIAHRAAPEFFVLDRARNVVFSSNRRIITTIVDHVSALLQSSSVGGLHEPVFERFDEETILRIVPNAGPDSGLTSVFIEEVKARSFAPAVSRFGLTPREVDVFHLIARGLTNVQIASNLSISEGTVGDHIKNLFRKTATNRRSELITRMHDLSRPATAPRRTLSCRVETAADVAAQI